MENDNMLRKGNVEMEFVPIPAGTFTMGNPDGLMMFDEGSLRQVTLNAFKMSKYEITFVQYDAFCEATGRSKPDDEGWGRGDRPVINESWHDAVAFCDWIGGGCRLPTEAEWEYACRAGTTTNYYTGDSLTKSQANFDHAVGRTTPVGSYAPNAWGLYDMHGNVWEWCADWFGDYGGSPQTNPTGSATGFLRVRRGGGWDFCAAFCGSVPVLLPSQHRQPQHRLPCCPSLSFGSGCSVHLSNSAELLPQRRE